MCRCRVREVMLLLRRPQQLTGGGRDGAALFIRVSARRLYRAAGLLPVAVAGVCRALPGHRFFGKFWLPGRGSGGWSSLLFSAFCDLCLGLKVSA